MNVDKMAAPTTPRRTSNQRFRTKFSVSYEALLAGEHPWLSVPGSSSSSSLTGTPTPLGSGYRSAGSSYFSSSSGKKPSAPRSRFYADILCLKVEADTVEGLVQGIPARLLVDDDEGSKGARIRDNIGSLWRECLRVWSEVGEGLEQPSSPSARQDGGIGSDEVRRSNAVETLLVLSQSLLAKSALTRSSTSLDLIWIFAGGIDEADDVFEGLVSAIDEGLRGELDSVSLRQRRPSRVPSSMGQNSQPQQPSAMTEVPAELPTLAELLHHRIKAVHLAIVWISHISSTNLAAYFVRRDLFVAACSLLSTVQSIRENVKSKAREGKAALAEADEDLLRTVVRNVSLLIGLLAGLGHGGSTSSSGEAGGSYSLSGASHSPYFRRLCDWVDGGSMSLLRDSASHDLEQTWRAYETGESPTAPATVTGPLAWGSTASLGVMSEGAKRLGLSRAGSESAENVSALLPPPTACSLLPVLLLVRANQAFVEIALNGNEEAAGDTQQSFASALLSLSSYLATHGSLSDRAKSYSRLSMMISLALLSSPAGMSAIVLSEQRDDLGMIKQCQQRPGPKPVRSLAVSNEPPNGGIGGLFSQMSIGGGTNAIPKPARLLAYVLDSCVQYLRYNLRKRLDVSGYLLCLEVVKLSIDCCAERRVLLQYTDWVELWRSIQTVTAFLVGRHTELHGVEIGKLAKGLLSTLSFALLESDHFLPSRQDVNVLIYELVRGSETLRRFACIAVAGKDPSTDTSADAAVLEKEANQIVDGVPGWRLVDMVLLAFEERLQEWKERKGSKNGFTFGLSVSNLTGGYFKGGESGLKSSTRDMPGIGTVMELIDSLDLERIIAVVQGVESGKSGAGPQAKLSRSTLLDEEWLERTESQCISEAFRYAAEDMRSLMVG